MFLRITQPPFLVSMHSYVDMNGRILYLLPLFHNKWPKTWCWLNLVQISKEVHCVTFQTKENRILRVVYANRFPQNTNPLEIRRADALKSTDFASSVIPWQEQRKKIQSATHRQSLHPWFAFLGCFHIILGCFSIFFILVIYNNLS